MVDLGASLSQTGNRIGTCRWLTCLGSMLPFLKVKDVAGVSLACADCFRYSYDAEVLSTAWSTLAKIASNYEEICLRFPFFLDVSQQPPGLQEGRNMQEGGRKRSIVEKTFEVVRECERSVLVHQQAMLSMLDFVSTVLIAFARSAHSTEQSFQILLSGLMNDVIVTLMAEWQALDECVAAKMLGVLAEAIQQPVECASAWASKLCAAGFVGTVISFLDTSSQTNAVREPAVLFVTNLLQRTSIIDRGDTLQALQVMNLDSMLSEVVRNGCETEHGHSFVEAAAALLAATLVHDEVPCDEKLSCKWAAQVSSTATEWKPSVALNLLVVLMELERRRGGSIDVHVDVIRRMFSRLKTAQLLRCPELIINLVAWLSSAKYERQLSAGLLLLWAETRATDAGKSRLVELEPKLFSALAKGSSAIPTETIVILFNHPQQSIRLAVLDMVKRWVESESESIKGLIGCGLVENLASRIMFPQASVDDLNGEYVEAAATFKTLESVIWHEDCMRGFVNMDVVLEIAQGCEKRLQNMFSRGQTTAANNEQELLSHILHVIGGVATLLKPKVLALFLDTNHEILTQLMTTPQTQSDACTDCACVAVVLLSLRTISEELKPDDLRSELRALSFQLFQVAWCSSFACSPNPHALSRPCIHWQTFRVIWR